MIYRNIEDIPYPFLHDAVYLMDKYTQGVLYTRLTKGGECAIIIKGKLSDDIIARCLNDLNPYVTSESSISDYKPLDGQNYDYTMINKEVYTVIYTENNIDYRKL